MSKRKLALPVETKVDYTTINGVPTITIAAALTTPLQVAALIDQLSKLSDVLPETRVRKPKAKSKNGPAKTRQTTTHEEETLV